MKITLSFIISLLFVVPVFADSTSYDINDELKSAKRLIYKERYKRAIKQLKTAVKEEPKNADAWNLLGYASRKQGKLDQSADAYSQALKVDPEHKDALEYQGELFLMQGDKAAARANLELLKSLCPDGCEQLDALNAALAAAQ